MCESRFYRCGSLIIQSMAFDPTTGKVCLMRGTIDRHGSEVG